MGEQVTMPDLTEDQFDEHARRLHQIRASDPAELTDTDVEAIAHAHHDGCVRMAAAELLTARAELAELRERVAKLREVAETWAAQTPVDDAEWIEQQILDGRAVLALLDTPTEPVQPQPEVSGNA